MIKANWCKIFRITFGLFSFGIPSILMVYFLWGVVNVQSENNENYFNSIQNTFFFLPIASNISALLALLINDMNWKRLIRFSGLFFIILLMYYLILPLGYALSYWTKDKLYLDQIVLGCYFIFLILLNVYLIIAPFKDKWWPKN